MEITREEMKSILQEILEDEGMIGSVPLGDKWKGGRLYFEPADASKQGYDIPIDTFFHKIVMVRDKLRVLEQNINSNKAISDEEKVNLQQYITKIYGTLTSFNVLFKDKDDHFVGQKTRM